jgi:hypothetical protein
MDRFSSAPKATPKSIIGRLNSVVAQMLADASDVGAAEKCTLHMAPRRN